jgi:predicted transposase YdaD
VNCDVPVPRLPNPNQDINLAAAAQMYVSGFGSLRKNTVAFMHGIQMTKFSEFGQVIFS